MDDEEEQPPEEEVEPKIIFNKELLAEPGCLGMLYRVPGKLLLLSNSVN